MSFPPVHASSRLYGGDLVLDDAVAAAVVVVVDLAGHHHLPAAVEGVEVGRSERGHGGRGGVREVNGAKQGAAHLEMVFFS